MTSPSAPHSTRRRASRTTRTRILEAARSELGRSPDSSLADIAEAAGVARRTVYGHFSGRSALVEGLAAEAGEAIRLAVAVTRGRNPDPPSALAGFVLTMWPVGDRYRVLIGLAHQDLARDRIRRLLAPARDSVAAILAEGQRQGVFHTSVPPGPLSRAVEAHLLALLESVNCGIWADDGTSAATAALIATGVDSSAAAATVHRLHGTGPTRSPL
ncbi:TetR/AcrR family transcriptional regulator [Streptomyces fulvoviolaceus]|uniref:TetR/AcrR family transcriptional regulator n=1 Tax=Streptomyces fulvoviolaceus TaxID=285535 RepID=UPI0021C163A1|nr:TetR/AcrR family transcriptional regulator [Streptomyces fulvoviolaceus]MCT9083707.1 TetR/AcrR family transcriptional regulator [Streptomyces fulvoviolaceus]